MLLSAVGNDAPGDLLVRTASDRGVNCGHITRVADATDTYLVIEQAWRDPKGEWQNDLANAYERFKKWERPRTS